jgi:pyruvate,orthophosphate dikinase
MIMAETIEDRKKILTKLGQLQKSDFIEIMKAMEGYEVTIRLLDPPLHEFLPNPEELSEKNNSKLFSIGPENWQKSTQ